MRKILFLTNRDQISSIIRSEWPTVKKMGSFGEQLQLEVMDVAAGSTQHQAGDQQLLTSCALLVVSWMGGGQDPYIKELCQTCSRQAVPYVITFTQPAEPVLFEAIPPDWAEIIRDYLLFGGSENIHNWFLWLAGT